VHIFQMKVLDTHWREPTLILVISHGVITHMP
jgi:hypothetical protein